MKGNVIDMAVGVVIGGAFGKIVTSLVNDIIMPLVGWLIGGVDFTKLKVELKGTLASNAVGVVNNAAEVIGVDGVQEKVDSLASAISSAPANVVINPVSDLSQQTVTLYYGNFIQQAVDFFIVALCIFAVLRVMVKASAKLSKKEEKEKEA